MVQQVRQRVPMTEKQVEAYNFAVNRANDYYRMVQQREFDRERIKQRV